jgi:hypothetical protein
MNKEEIGFAAANLADPNICKTDNWIAGAQWYAETTDKIYSREDLEKLKDFDTWKEWKNTGIIKY